MIIKISIIKTEMNSSEVKTKDICETTNKLEDVWNFFFFKMDKQKQWIDNMHKVCSVDSIESFWGIMHHLRSVSDLQYGCDYYFFRKNIEPMWESPMNKNGGIWVISSHKSKRNSELNLLWIEVLMFLIGETMGEDSDQICGASINMRGNYDKISVWTTDSTNNEVNTRIGMELKSILKLDHQIEYISHFDNQNKNNSSAKPTLTI